MKISKEQMDFFLNLVNSSAEKTFEELGIDEKIMQKLTKNSDSEEFQRIIKETIIRFFEKSWSSQSEVLSPYGYPCKYHPKEIWKQVEIIRNLFPEMKNETYDEKIPKKPVPYFAENWFAIPRWEKISPTYSKAVEKVFDLIERSIKGSFFGYKEGWFDYLKPTEKTERALQEIGAEQKGHDILIIPCQFGFRRRGCSFSRAHETMVPREFGLNLFAVGVMLLTHPEREVEWEQLHATCIGDEYDFSPDTEKVSKFNTRIELDVGYILFNELLHKGPSEKHGPVTGLF